MREKILPASEASLRVHGNGFLQAETKCGNKFHIWDTRLPRQKVPTFLHNHNHGFRSTVLHGSIKWIEYNLMWGGGEEPFDDMFVPHQCVPRKGKDTRLEPSTVRIKGSNSDWRLCSLFNSREFVLRRGSEYQWPLDMELYHEVHPIWIHNLKSRIDVAKARNGEYFIIDRYLPTDEEIQPRYDTVITFVERMDYCEDLPTVLVPYGQEPDNDFDRYAFERQATFVYEQAMEII